MKGLIIEGGLLVKDGECIDHYIPPGPGLHHWSDRMYPYLETICDEQFTAIYTCFEPIKDYVLSEISNPEYDLICIHAHGGSTIFKLTHYPEPDEYISYNDIQEAMENRDPYKVVFLFMCEAMSYLDREYIPYQLTKGETNGVSVVGYDNKGLDSVYKYHLIMPAIINGSSVYSSYLNLMIKYDLDPEGLKFYGDPSYIPKPQNNLQPTNITTAPILVGDQPEITITFNKIIPTFTGTKTYNITRDGEYYYACEVNYGEYDGTTKQVTIILPEEQTAGITSICIED